MSDTEQGFTVNDKRFFNQDGSQKEEEESSPNDSGAGAEPRPSPDQTAKEEFASGEYRNLPPVDFGKFIISLAHAAMYHMGQGGDSAAEHKDLTLARHTIDSIAMLKNKTTGNLAPEEQSLIDGILAELRIQYVQTCKKQ
jgi:hypothetical protein